jgi:hypothetical protein
MHSFPIEKMDEPTNLVARGKRPQLLTDKFAKRLLTPHCLGLLGVRKLVFGESAKRSTEHFAIQSFLAVKVLINRGLIDVGPFRNGSDAGRFVAAFGEQPHRSF